MTGTLEIQQQTPVIYPSEDGEPLAETYDHLYAILVTLEVLRQYLIGRQATVLGDQFLYYSQAHPRMRVAPDVMVIFNVEPGGRDNYKVWEEGQVPSVIFEMTSPSTRKQDMEVKRTLYEQLGVEEYWLFDPRGEWIPEQLQGYRLISKAYEAIADSYSTALGLQLTVEGKLIAFYRGDTGERLLMPEELRLAWQQEREQAQLERERAQLERERADRERERAEALAAQLRALGIDPEA
ncbi:Uma2 family endonuclease [Oscillatoria sp. HE19RPO]|uniref:Uma2 family endonuclease n=1 Tax=Oscillatoria sp. HE19RPO TaxID=2954806 RepID=UPI0020C23C9A|nr:Uma2 family endonuclease [Oscillatoria sp. HE19RPO]